MNPKIIISCLVLGGLLVAVELFYFRIAENYRIIDKPNERSSHGKAVIRGGGLIFIVAILIWFFYESFSWPWFILGVTGVAIVSFLDDIISQPPWVRITVHVLAVLLMFFQVTIFSWPLWLVLIALVVCIGTLNAFNFMDGINGITGAYSLVCLLTFWYIDHYIISFTIDSFIVALVIAVGIFLFFNFRVKARCFAGDIGSVTIAFILVFLLLQLIYSTGNFAWALLFLVFGIDSVITIIYRLRNRENIFYPHRTHLYQYFCNELKIPHLWVSLLYGLTQLIINVVVIRYFDAFDLFTICFLMLYVILYLVVREATLRRIQRPGLFTGRVPE